MGGGSSCRPAAVSLPRVLRQSFEDPRDPTLTFSPAARGWLTEAPRPGEPRLAGGHGRRFLDSFRGGGSPSEGEVIWGPLRPAGQTFAALVAGHRDDPDLAVLVEASRGGAWVEIARLPPPRYPTVMTPQRVHLPAGTDPLRVRVLDHAAGPESYLLVDALTFIEE
jgi:hypothetical protein